MTAPQALPPIGPLHVRMVQMADVWRQLLPMHQDHYAEAEPYQPLEFNPDYPGYLTLERFGDLSLAAAFDGDRVVGYLMCIISRDLHRLDRWVANEAGVYIMPRYRGLPLLRQLYEHMEQYLRRHGVDRVYMTSREIAGGAKLGAYLQRRGYQPLAEVWVKKLELIGGGR